MCMRKYFFIFSFSFFYHFTFSQQYYPFPTDSAQWSIEIATPQFEFYHYQLKLKGDTILPNGETYSKLYKSFELDYNSPDQILHCFLREDSTRKIFVKYPEGNAPDTNEFVLYDYGLEVGDTFQIRLFDSESIYLFNQVVYTKHIVDLYIDHPRGEYGLMPLNGDTIWTPFFDNSYGWYEGIGTNLGLLYNELPPGYGETETSFLVCFNLKGQYIMSVPNCGNVGIDDIRTQKTGLKIVPNPITYMSEIIFPHPMKEIQEINIINYYGQPAKKIIKPEQHEMFISATEFMPGLYFLSITTTDNKIFYLKFIIS